MRILLAIAALLSLAACTGIHHDYPNDNTARNADRDNRHYHHSRSMNHPQQRYHNETWRDYHADGDVDVVKHDRWEYRPCTPHRVRDGVC